MIVVSMSKKATVELTEATAEDEELQLLIKYILQGFPDESGKLPAGVRHYYNFREELAYHNGIVFKSDKIIVPQKLISKMLKAIHTGHFGIQSCLKRARQGLYWKGQYSDILEMVKSCPVCEKTQRAKDKEEVLIREIPTLPWQIVASDILYFKNDPYLVITDSYSNYTDLKKLTNQTSQEIIEHLKNWFYVHGVPEIFENDNDTSYESKEFEDFATTWCFSHRTSSPLHSGNGLAERAVQLVKNILRKCSLDNTDYRLALLNWNNTPRDPILGSPNQKLCSRITRSQVPTSNQNLQPKTIEGVANRLKILREEQTSYANRSTVKAENISTYE
ncbi:PREDICTED: uncharacterized protein K02A2.6-like [Rhagoletis zephyria]|nr:PREDICTED: uncharacterized protein K02A2.6-like [Rhagoletis zephyria]XP_017469875.1 PREDICTED: uncharacterized protein K02A2.6-like [Rhagoletis zephyria]